VVVLIKIGQDVAKNNKIKIPLLIFIKAEGFNRG